MPFVYKSSNPVEASFVQAFFRDKGLASQLIATGGIYGTQNYDISVDGDVDEEMQRELRARINDSVAVEEPDSDAADSDVPSPAASPQDFSFLGTLLIFAIAFVAFYSTSYSAYWFSVRWLTSILSFQGAQLLGYFAEVFFIYVCCRKKYGNQTNSFLGLVPASGLSILLGIAGIVVWKLVSLGLIAYFSVKIPGTFSGSNLPLRLIVAPIFIEIVFRGFLLKSLEASVKMVPALIISSLVFGLSHFQSSLLLQSLAFGSGLLYGIARVKSGSVVPPIAMAITGTLITAISSF